MSAPQLLNVRVRQCLEDSEQNDDLINQSINELVNYKGVYKTALATPGLLNVLKKSNY